MVLNHHFWSHHFSREFVPQLRAIADALESRLLPTFAAIDKEAEQVSEAAWNEMMSHPGTGDEDPADYAEAAEQKGVSHYMMWYGIRQGIVNLFAAALYHAFEQQVVLFLRQEVLELHEQNEPEFFKLAVLNERLKVIGIDLETLQSWAIVDELRLVANAVKHGEGLSSAKLHELRPDLFQHPDVNLGPAFRNAIPRVFQPLAGDDLYVSLKDVQQYRDALERFWTELGESLARV